MRSKARHDENKKSQIKKDNRVEMRKTREAACGASDHGDARDYFWLHYWKIQPKKRMIIF